MVDTAGPADGRKSIWEGENQRALQSEGEGRQTATLLLWTPRSALFHTVRDSLRKRVGQHLNLIIEVRRGHFQV